MLETGRYKLDHGAECRTEMDVFPPHVFEGLFGGSRDSLIISAILDPGALQKRDELSVCGGLLGFVQDNCFGARERQPTRRWSATVGQSLGEPEYGEILADRLGVAS